MSHDVPQTDPVRAAPLAYAITPRRRRWWPLLTLGGLVLVAPLVVSVLMPSFQGSPDRPLRPMCARNLRMIGTAVWMYANEHGGSFPNDLATVLLMEELGADAFVCPATDNTAAGGATTRAVAANLTAGGHLSYLYAGKGLTVKSPGDAVVAYEPLSNHGAGMNVLYADTHVDWVDAPKARKLMAELNAGHNPPRPEVMR